MPSTKEQASKQFQEIQNSIFSALSELDGEVRETTDCWEREPSGGGGVSKVMQDGRVFEKGGVNFSEVHGVLPTDMSEKLTGKAEEQEFFATGTSLVIHPLSPLVPTVHANIRYLEVADQCWVGGGTDLTPYYLREEDAIHFHQTLKDVCDKHDDSYYPKFKKWCDEYFYLPHRKETRGVGGIFFDYLGKGEPEKIEEYLGFATSVGNAFLQAYQPIVEKRQHEEWTEKQKDFQLKRRGRYVEFNLIWDRGTLFGLKTNGRTESILMSLPAQAHWEYNPEPPEAGSEEAKLIEVLKNPRNWL